MRTIISTNTQWEQKYGYARAVRIGNVVEVAGTVAVDENGKLVGKTVYEQTRFILRKIENALKEVGADLKDVIRTRWYLTDISLLDEAGRAHGEIFCEIRPVATAVEVTALAGDQFLIEIEASASLSNKLVADERKQAE